jgi:hypothetical protein
VPAPDASFPDHDSSDEEGSPDDEETFGQADGGHHDLVGQPHTDAEGAVAAAEAVAAEITARSGSRWARWANEWTAGRRSSWAWRPLRAWR